MNKLFKIIIGYGIGIACVFALAWRVNTIDEHNTKVACNDEIKVVCNN